MTAARLQEAALVRFATQGFDAASLEEIATDVGIKKPSIYAHFRSKDALYMSLIPLMITAELDYARAAFDGSKPVNKQILAYLQSIQTRYEESPRVQFWMRALYTPPLHLYEQVMALMHVFMDDLEVILKRAIQRSDLVPNAHKLSADTLVMTCMSMIDSLQVELTYGGTEKFKRRLKALWAVFEAATVQRPTSAP
ncbi:TetR/AcrR family transcriptional regulator [Ottowia thiooxydans]|uniref:TetR/AcrR family transcriptional regulator n=1 Tax=Ottowia thiooxydans TaxID=219182 RepID=UPI000419A88F|nr:TetR/AcrR family transcriptional regulator [Ottowia thiooxydans]